MTSWETYTCTECGEEFKADPGANAAEGYCSPQCATSGKDFA